MTHWKEKSEGVYFWGANIQESNSSGGQLVIIFGTRPMTFDLPSNHSRTDIQYNYTPLLLLLYLLN